MKTWFGDIDIGQEFSLIGKKFKKLSENSAEQLNPPANYATIFLRLCWNQEILVT